MAAKARAHRVKVIARAPRLARVAARKAGELSRFGRSAVNVAILGGGIWLAAISAAALIPILAGAALAVLGLIVGLALVALGLSLINGKGNSL